MSQAECHMSDLSSGIFSLFLQFCRAWFIQNQFERIWKLTEITNHTGDLAASYLYDGYGFHPSHGASFFISSRNSSFA